ncbi:unnamed protein product [Closterium sp. Naga37s-1]|nr:unnamed protein product [Closterium sp. Naga37s-1]
MSVKPLPRTPRFVSAVRCIEIEAPCSAAERSSSGSRDRARRYGKKWIVGVSTTRRSPRSFDSDQLLSRLSPSRLPSPPIAVFAPAFRVTRTGGCAVGPPFPLAHLPPRVGPPFPLLPTCAAGAVAGGGRGDGGQHVSQAQQPSPLSPRIASPLMRAGAAASGGRGNGGLHARVARHGGRRGDLRLLLRALPTGTRASLIRAGARTPPRCVHSPQVRASLPGCALLFPGARFSPLIRAHLEDAGWMRPSSSSHHQGGGGQRHGMRVSTVVAHDCVSVGDALRHMDHKGVIRGDFILVSGDVIANVSLTHALHAHSGSVGVVWALGVLGSAPAVVVPTPGRAQFIGSLHGLVITLQSMRTWLPIPLSRPHCRQSAPHLT